LKIVHVCLSCFYIDGYAYQENILVAEHVRAGHDVQVIASTESYDKRGHLTYLTPGAYIGTDGALVTRLQYRYNFFPRLARKVRAYIGLDKILQELNPEIIIFHGLCAWSLLTVAAYVRRNPSVKLFADCHEDSNNSARTWVSRELLHKRFYKSIFLRCVDQIREVLCITVESLDFAIDFYGSPRDKTRIYPLGCTIESPESVAQRRADFRARHGFDDSDIVITQTGKLDHTKQLESSLIAFCANSSPHLKLVIAGSMSDDVRSRCLPLIQSDSRILDLGWQTPDELRTVLAGADCFLQPFGQTATTQMAMGYGCVILAQDVPSHRWLVGDNEFLFKDSSELPLVLKRVIDNQKRLDQSKRANSQFAAAHLDYKQLALQIAS
jgi:glycosyltransferase involved in cell wall biosynthesis